MKISDRQGKILNWIVQDYIDTAEPIGSEYLDKKHKTGLSPATLRNEMQKLDEAGFIHQPYTSAGRVPTDKGYRFFVNNLLNRQKILKYDSDEKKFSEFEKFFKQGREDIFKFTAELTKFFADTSSSFTLLHLLEKDFFWRDGWEEILREPEFGDRGLISDFTSLLEEVEEHVENLEDGSGIKIYIGKEGPFPKSKNFSIISSVCYLPDHEKAILTILGPKRMDYDRNIGLMNSLTKLLDNF